MSDAYDPRDPSVSVDSGHTLVSRVGPPLTLLGLAMAEVAVLGLAFVPSTRLWHWIGYLGGAVVLPCTVSAYRWVDRTRQRSARYAQPGWASYMPAFLLVGGIGLAAGHALYLAMTRRLA